MSEKLEPQVQKQVEQVLKKQADEKVPEGKPLNKQTDKKSAEEELSDISMTESFRAKYEEAETEVRIE